jgi:hypothetical protein
MNRKTMQIVIVVVCLIVAAIFIAYSMGFFSGGGPGTGGTPENPPQIQKAPDS